MPDSCAQIKEAAFEPKPGHRLAHLQLTGGWLKRAKTIGTQVRQEDQVL